MTKPDKIVQNLQGNKNMMLIRNGSACPFVAQKGDSETHYNFATTANYCHQVKPPQRVALSYQDAVCLTEKYSTCPVYLESWKGSLPSEIRGRAPRKKVSPGRIWRFLLVLLVILGLVWLALNPALWQGVLANFSPTQMAVTYILPSPSHSPTMRSTPQAGSASGLTATTTPAVVVQAADTLAPSATYPIPTLGPFFKTPFGPYGRYLIHKVSAGESVGKIAGMYNTTSAVIIAVNRLVEDYYFFGETTPTPLPQGPYFSPTPTLGESQVPTKTLPATATKAAIPSATKRVRETITQTPTPYLTPEVWTTVLIHPGDILVILPNMKDPQSVNQMQAIYLERLQKVADLARLYGLTEDELRYYNALGPGDLVAADRWIVVPFGGQGPPPTPVPTLLATIDLSSALTPKFGPDEAYVLHMVRPGENLPYIAALYHTTEEVLHLTNQFETLQPGQVLVVLPGRSDMHGLRAFGTLLVEDDIPVGILASQMKVFENDLVWYNGLEDDQVVVAGQWLIYPNPEPTATWTHEPEWTATPGPKPTKTRPVGPPTTPTDTPPAPTRTPHP